MDFDSLTLQRFSLIDQRTESSSFGVLSIKVNNLIILDPIADKDCEGMNIVLKVQEHCKYFGVQQISSVINWDIMKQVFIDVSSHFRHPYNEVVFEFILQGKGSRLWSTINLHLHDIVKSSPISTILDIWGPFGRIGKIEFEFTFSYGSFGYGNSCSFLSKSDSIYTLYPEFKNATPEQYEFPDYIPSKQISDFQRDGKQSYIPDESTDMTEQLLEYFSETKRSSRLLNLKKQLLEKVEKKEFLPAENEEKFKVEITNVKRVR